jgi:hypothetical protein
MSDPSDRRNITDCANGAKRRCSSPDKIAANSCPFCLQHAAEHWPQGLEPMMAMRRLLTRGHTT